MEKRESLWTATCEIEKRESLQEEFTEVDAVVIGAGLAGILTANMLKAKGIDTIVLEAGRIGRGTTGYTTAKLTSQHDMIYDRLITDLGMEKALQYAAANQRAIAFFRQLVQERAIECRLEEKNACLYTVKEDKAKELQKEAMRRQSLGFQIRFWRKAI